MTRALCEDLPWLQRILRVDVYKTKKKYKNRGGHITKTITNNYLHYSPNPFDYNTPIYVQYCSSLVLDGYQASISADGDVQGNS
jgi:hypothetical protein